MPTATGRRLVTLGVLLTLVAGLARLPGLFTEFWLDEIWALRNVLPLHRALGVLSAVHHDSNHYLTSFWMYALGDGKSFAWYRLPSFFAGMAAVPLAGALARVDREGRPVLAMTLVAVSFVLGFYSSEARGYSLAVAAALAALYCFVRFAGSGDARWLAGYSVATGIGILAHLSFVIALGSAIVFGLVLVGRGRMRLSTLAALHVVPMVLLAALFALDLRYLRVGGGPHEPPSLLLVRTASLSVGGPFETPEAFPFAGLAVLLVLSELGRRLRRFWPSRSGNDPGSHLWVFYAVVVLAPVWLALVLDPPFLFPRYFLVSVAFVPLLAASLLGALGRRSRVVLLAVLLGANGWAWVRFSREGRGHYRDALYRILESAPGRAVTVGSDQDFRNEMIVRFYREHMGPSATRLTYLPRESGRADFWIGSVDGTRCGGCRLLDVYPSSPLSGARWRLYRTRPSGDEGEHGGESEQGQKQAGDGGEGERHPQHEEEK